MWLDVAAWSSEHHRGHPPLPCRQNPKQSREHKLIQHRKKHILIVVFPPERDAAARIKRTLRTDLYKDRAQPSPHRAEPVPRDL